MAAVKQIGIGVVGCGTISYTYMSTLSEYVAAAKFIGCSDIIPERAEKNAKLFGCKAMTNEEIYEDPEIDIVLNLTNVWSHYEVSKAALEHGKHVYSEKMAAENFDRAKELYDIAQEKGVMFAIAPDTFLGGGYQTCRYLIDSGAIGIPFTAEAKIIRGYVPKGREVPKSNVFVDGGSIPFDMGGYYLHALQCMFGPVKRVAGFAKHLYKEFTNPGNPKWGEEFKLNSPNLTVATLEHWSGVLTTFTAGDSGYMCELPGIYVHGTGGTLFCPDPNTYGGPVKLLKPGYSDYMEVPMTHGYNGLERFPIAKFGDDERFNDFWEKSRRGVGPADMCWALINDRPARITNEFGLHTIEIIHAIEACGETGKVYEMTTKPIRPVALRPGFMAADMEAVFNDKWDDSYDDTPWWCK